MWKQIAIAGAVGAAILGTGAAALAETGSTSSTASSTPGSSTPTAGGKTAVDVGAHAGAGKLKGKLALALRNFEHGSWVTDGKSGTETHDAIKGTVTAVSSTSISVKAGDGTAETFAVNSTTAVRVKGTGKSTIAAVKVNDTVLVAGTKSGNTDTALHVLDGGAK